MESNLPRKENLAEQAAEGRPITQADASAIATAESDVTGRGPIKGGPAAVAQSLHDRQQNYFETAGDIARKPAEDITKEDAARLQHAEARVLGHPPGKGTVSAVAQSLADQNAGMTESA